MQIEINDKTYDLHFGLDFIEYLDKKYKVQQNGLEMGMGVLQAAIGLEQANALILVDLIKAGTATANSKPGVTEIKKWIESQEDLEPLFDDFLSELENASVTKVALKRMKEQAAQQAQMMQ